jgi:hypothetical protein
MVAPTPFQCVDVTKLFNEVNLSDGNVKADLLLRKKESEQITKWNFWNKNVWLYYSGRAVWGMGLR